MKHDRRSFIPTDHTVTFLKDEMGIDLFDWAFHNSDQTGSMVMCDVYASVHDSLILVISEDGAGVYSNLEDWRSGEAEDVGYCNFEDWSGARWDDEGEVIATAYPTDNFLPALWILAQMWSWDKYQKIISCDIPDDRRAVILEARMAKGETS